MNKYFNDFALSTVCPVYFVQVETIFYNSGFMPVHLGCFVDESEKLHFVFEWVRSNISM